MKKTIPKKKSIKALIALIILSSLVFPRNTIFATESKENEKSETSPVSEIELIKKESSQIISENIKSSNNIVKGDEDEENMKKDERDFSNVVRQTTEYTCGPAALATLII